MGNYKSLPRNTKPFTDPFGAAKYFRVSADNQIVYKPITFNLLMRNYERELYNHFTSMRKSVHAFLFPPQTVDLRYIRLFTPAYSGLFYDDATDTYYLGLANIIRDLGANSSVMEVDVLFGREYYRIDQHIYLPYDYRSVIHRKDKINSNDPNLVEVLLRFFQYDLCTAYQFRCRLQAFLGWFKIDSHYIFTTFSLLFAYSELPQVEGRTFPNHIREHFTTNSKSEITCPRPRVVLNMIRPQDYQYFRAPNEMDPKYRQPVEDLLKAVLNAENELMRQVRAHF